MRSIYYKDGRLYRVPASYHIVFCGKHRRKLFRKDGAEEVFRMAVTEEAKDLGIRILLIECRNEYAHLLATDLHRTSLSAAVTRLKRAASAALKKDVFGMNERQSLWTEESFTCPNAQFYDIDIQEFIMSQRRRGQAPPGTVTDWSSKEGRRYLASRVRDKMYLIREVPKYLEEDLYIFRLAMSEGDDELESQAMEKASPYLEMCMKKGMSAVKALPQADTVDRLILEEAGRGRVMEYLYSIPAWDMEMREKQFRQKIAVLFIEGCVRKMVVSRVMNTDKIGTLRAAETIYKEMEGRRGNWREGV